MPHSNYILYSKSRNRFYVGETADLASRLKRHNSGQVKSTKGGVPWEVIWQCEVEDRSVARKIESKIKSRGARRYLADLGYSMEEH
ncbi:GIY-YIG nuclease family protein [Dokdonia sinensis]|uniref:GIY-YIG nuclease family protein n=1 Tax=Dokdonia sinensis TaxID=2479847 RepID=A0A3M0GG66_9FLAO|nr:GIY-YIG nuclease family protein [Dokdonia sinensis]RMB63925.1 GIY-YIG nuclease family protein [Dokdonia sinensis]